MNMKHIHKFEDFLNESLNENANISKLSDDMLLVMIDTFNDYHKNAKGNVSDKDMEFMMDLMKEKQKRGLKESVTESAINEGIMSLSAYYKDYDKEIKAPAKKIDDILNKEIKSVSAKNAVLDLITDLADEYAVAYSDNQKMEY